MRIGGVLSVCYSRGVKFVHAADLHIDSPLRGLDKYEGAPAARLRAATRHALENLVALCIEEEAAFLLLAGDVFDGGWKDFSTGLFFATQMTRLREAGIPVVIVRGNHDAASSITKNLTLRLPDNVHELSSKKAETFELADAGVCVHGQSFAKQATTDDLAARYPDAVRGAFNIGLLHTCLDGREGHDRYAPTSLETMRAKGYDYWALGHVHVALLHDEGLFQVSLAEVDLLLAEKVRNRSGKLQASGQGNRTHRIVRGDRRVVRLCHPSDEANLCDPSGMAQVGLQDRSGALFEDFPESPFSKNALSGGNGQIGSPRNVSEDVHVLAVDRLFDEHRLIRLQSLEMNIG